MNIDDFFKLESFKDIPGNIVLEVVILSFIELLHSHCEDQEHKFELMVSFAKKLKQNFDLNETEINEKYNSVWNFLQNAITENEINDILGEIEGNHKEGDLP